MKNIKYIFGLGVIVGILDVAVIYILKVADVINSADFSENLNRSLMIIGVVMVAVMIISLVFRMFQQDQK